MEPLAGTQVTPAVRLVRPLGQGGMGAVWVAQHLSLRTEVVVKFMADALAADPVSLARFSREASAAAAVKSPHVVQMLDHGFTEDGTAFIVMELLEGEDLRKRLLRERVVPLPELAIIVSHACKALGRAHQSGIIHRDIKPENIFLCHTDDGEPFVKLLDFGIARSGGPADFHMTQTGVTVGTPFYMSPEQAMGAPPVDATTDLWSLGVVAFEAMTGMRPFDGPTIGALTIAICGDSPPVPSTVEPTVPAELDAWMARACARDRRQRFPNAKAMSHAFLAAAGKDGAARGVPLAFDDTALGEEVPAALFTPQMTPQPRSTPVQIVSSPHETASGLATTMTPLSRTQDSPLAQPVPFAPVQKPMPRPAPRGRGVYVAAGVGIIAVGVGLGFVFASRGEPPTAGPAEPTVPQPPVAAAAPPASVDTPPRPLPSAASVVTPAPSAVASVVAPPPVHTSQPPPPVPAHAPPTPPAVAPAPRPHASTTPQPPSSPPGCNPPYYFDSSNNKVFKKECL